MKVIETKRYGQPASPRKVQRSSIRRAGYVAYVIASLNDVQVPSTDGYLLTTTCSSPHRDKKGASETVGAFYRAANPVVTPWAVADNPLLLYSGQTECPSPNWAYKIWIRPALRNSFIFYTKCQLQLPDHDCYGESKNGLWSLETHHNDERHDRHPLARCTSRPNKEDERKQANPKAKNHWTQSRC